MFELGILVGFKCNFKCSHCITNSSPSRTDSVTEKEIFLIVDEIIRNKSLINRIIFSGGEPTLEINKIEKILIELTTNKIDIDIAMVSNGSFLFSQALTNRVLALSGLKHINLSIDEFHEENKSIPVEKILEFNINLKKKGISLEVGVVLGSPLGYQFLFLNKFEAIVTTHWMAYQTDKMLRKIIHKYFFDKLNSFSIDLMIASIFFRNDASMNLFKKNNYTLFSMKVLNL